MINVIINIINKYDIKESKNRTWSNSLERKVNRNKDEIGSLKLNCSRENRQNIQSDKSTPVPSNMNNICTNNLVSEPSVSQNTNDLCESDKTQKFPSHEQFCTE